MNKIPPQDENEFNDTCGQSECMPLFLNVSIRKKSGSKKRTFGETELASQNVKHFLGD